MTSIDQRPATASDVLDATERLAPTIRARRAEIEAARRVPRELLDALIHTGCPRILRPSSHGGLGAELADGMRVFESLARADASTAWIVMIGGSVWLDLTGLPRATFDALFANPDAIGVGAFNPTGSIRPDGGGYRVTGRWGFASGCEHADWLYGNCVEDIGPDGFPRLRTALFTPAEVMIEDTWTVCGLCGTGSHHFRAADVWIPAERTCRPMVDEPCLDAPVARIPVPALLSLAVASVALGTATGALDDILAIAGAKVPLLAGAPLATDPMFQSELATADTELRAARALLYEVAGSAWATAEAGSPFTLEQRARPRASATWATARAAAVVESAYRAGGGTSLYAECPLRQRLRDVHALGQHFLVKQPTMGLAGAVLAGQELTVPVF